MRGRVAFWDSLSHREERHFQQELALYPVIAILIIPLCTLLHFLFAGLRMFFKFALNHRALWAINN